MKKDFEKDIRIKNKQKFINFLTFFGFALSIFAFILFYRMGVFTHPAAMRALVKSHGIIGPLVVIALQIIQVVIPVLPGGFISATSVLVFGSFMGFLYNYIGVVIGSIILFEMGRIYGTPFVKLFVPKKTYEKYVGKLSQGRAFDWFFMAMIFAPIAPDDALVLLASQTKMTYRFFLTSIIFGKIFGVAMYSFAWVYGLDWLQKLLN